MPPAIRRLDDEFRRPDEFAQANRAAAKIGSLTRASATVRDDRWRRRRDYFAATAGFALLALASARRSVFFRRLARVFTLSLPLLCPIGHAPDTRPGGIPSGFATALGKKPDLDPGRSSLDFLCPSHATQCCSSRLLLRMNSPFTNHRCAPITPPCFRRSPNLSSPARTCRG